jgi:low temperature requirement protein LtrA
MTTSKTGAASARWRVPMVSRAVDEPHRVSSPLELLFDLTFVVAVSQAAAELGHYLEAGHIGSAISGYLQVFFAIWWAWMNFTWFASAYDTDDVPYRLMTALQMGGVLVLAAGVPAAFEHQQFATITAGYVIMRLSMVGQWLRAAGSDRLRRSNALRYAIGITAVQVLWVARLGLPHRHGLASFLVLIVLEMAVPLWAERSRGSVTARMTTWHPHHIAERYGLFTIIVLGECVLAATTAIQSSFTANGVSTSLVLVGIGSLLLLFGLWWLYFVAPVGEGLSSRPNVAFYWGYGHYFVFAALAALGAGLEVSAAGLQHHLAVSERAIGYAVAVPVVIYLVLLRLLHGTVLTGFNVPLPLLAGALLLILLVPLAAHPLGAGGMICSIALVVAALLATRIVVHSRVRPAAR